MNNINNFFRDSFQPNTREEGVKFGRFGTHHVRYTSDHMKSASKTIFDLGNSLKNYLNQEKSFAPHSAKLYKT